MCEYCDEWIKIKDPIEKEKKWQEYICKHIKKKRERIEEFRLMGGC